MMLNVLLAVNVLLPLFPLMAGGENICGINALFGAVRRQREELNIIDRKSMEWFKFSKFKFLFRMLTPAYIFSLGYF